MRFRHCRPSCTHAHAHRGRQHAQNAVQTQHVGSMHHRHDKRERMRVLQVISRHRDGNTRTRNFTTPDTNAAPSRTPETLANVRRLTRHQWTMRLAHPNTQCLHSDIILLQANTNKYYFFSRNTKRDYASDAAWDDERLCLHNGHKNTSEHTTSLAFKAWANAMAPSSLTLLLLSIKSVSDELAS